MKLRSRDQIKVDGMGGAYSK